MSFLAGAAVGAGSVVFLQICFIVGFVWATPKLWRWVKRSWADAWGLEW